MAVEILTSALIPFEIETIIALEPWLQRHQGLIRPYLHKCFAATDDDLLKISNLTTPNQVFIVLKRLSFSLDQIDFKNSFSLYLDNIQDPGNMGTILRIADWFGISYVFCAQNSVDTYHPKVVQASMGAFLRVKTIETNFDHLLKYFPKDMPIMGAVMLGQNVFDFAPPTSGILVMGNEGEGISEAILPQITHHLTIPRHPQGNAESLNVAIATGILCAILRK